MGYITCKIVGVVKKPTNSQGNGSISLKIDDIKIRVAKKNQLISTQDYYEPQKSENIHVINPSK
jgi:hypothetical protein